MGKERRILPGIMINTGYTPRVEGYCSLLLSVFTLHPEVNTYILFTEKKELKKRHSQNLVKK